MEFIFICIIATIFFVGAITRILLGGVNIGEEMKAGEYLNKSFEENKKQNNLERVNEE